MNSFSRQSVVDDFILAIVIREDGQMYVLLKALLAQRTLSAISSFLSSIFFNSFSFFLSHVCIIAPRTLSSPHLSPPYIHIHTRFVPEKSY